MRKLLSIFMVSLFLLVSITDFIHADTRYIPASDYQAIDEKLQWDIQEIITDGKAAGASSVFIQGDEIFHAKGYGYADKALDTHSDGNTTGFRIGSISKTFVAVAALRAVQDGKLDLDTDISVYLEDDSPKLRYSVNMHQLLTHTAGFEDMITGIAVGNVSDTEPLGTAVRKYAPDQISVPGEISSYSNYGLALAAYVVEKATNKDFSSYCTENIFEPLEMNRTTFEHMHDKVIVSKAYLPDGSETLDPYINLYPEGSAVSTAEDMGKFISWLLDDTDTVIDPELKQQLFDRQYSMADELSGIGYVFNRKERIDSLYLEKKGETLNFYSRIVLYPEYKTGFFLSFNTFVKPDEIDKIVEHVTSSLIGKKTVSGDRKIAGSIDISACYVNAWSGFNHEEKLLRFILPGKMTDISGSAEDGYTFNEEKMTYLGDEYYDTPIGKVKFILKDEKLIMATDFSQTYFKINGLENRNVTLILTLLFVIGSLITAAVSLKADRKLRTFAWLSLLQLAAFSAFLVIYYIGIMDYAVLNYKIYLNMSAWIILFPTVVYSALIVIHQRKRLFKVPKYIYIQSFISILFCLVMYNLKLM